LLQRCVTDRWSGQDGFPGWSVGTREKYSACWCVKQLQITRRDSDTIKHELTMLIYLDNCCFNRPYDDQSHSTIFLETQAKLGIQENILSDKYQLVWSYVHAI
jgi:hypothetical protein